MIRVPRTIAKSFKTMLSVSAATAVLASPLAAPARASTEAEAAVGLFSRLCYETMPDIAAAESLVGESWQALTGKDLEAFRPSAGTTTLKAWTFSEGGSNFSFSLSSGPMDDEGKKDFPNFADATNFGCSLILNASKAPSAAIAAEVEKLLERKPDETYDEGPFNVRAWSGGAEGLLVVLYYYAPKSGASGGLLSMTVFENP